MCILQAHIDNKFGLAWVSILLSLCHALESTMTSFLKKTTHIWLLSCAGIPLDVSTSQKNNITYLNLKKKCYRNAMLLITASDVHMHTQHISGSLLATKTKQYLTDTSLLVPETIEHIFTGQDCLQNKYFPSDGNVDVSPINPLEPTVHQIIFKCPYPTSQKTNLISPWYLYQTTWCNIQQ